MQWRAVVTGLAIAGFAVPSLRLHAEAAKSADSFVDSIGINIHMSYTNTPYSQQWPKVLAAMKALGIRHYRDGFYPWKPTEPYYTNHRALGAAGIHCDLIIPYNPATTAAQIQQFAGLATDVEALEDPNEFNASRRPDWVGKLKTMFPIIDEAAKALKIPVYGPSFTRANAFTEVGDIASTMSYNNLHVYFGGRHPGSHGWGPQNYGSIDYWKRLAAIDGPGKPIVVTETGYMTEPSKPYTVPQELETSYTLRTQLDMFEEGIYRTYIYELLDEASSPNYGIMTADVTPKPAYTGLQHLIALLSDRGGASFKPSSLNYSLQGAAPDVDHVLLEKHDGTFYLVLWVEEASYDAVKAMATPVAPKPLTVQLAGSAKATRYMEIHNDGSLTTEALSGAESIPFNVTDRISIIEIGGSATAAPARRRTR